MTDIILISNDQIYLDKKKLYADFNDIINVIEAIQKNFNIFLISKKSKNKKNFLLKISNKIKNVNFKSILYLKRKKNLKIFMVSITPRNLLFFFIIKLLIGKIDGYVYLRSNGHKEYGKKIGLFGSFIYDLMKKYLENNLKTISVSKEIISSKYTAFLTPSELDQMWFKRSKKVNIDIPKLLYFGRFKKEKGVYSLINLFSRLKLKHKLTIAGDSNFIGTNDENIKFLNEITDKLKVIELYDSHNIFILPSYTEGAPKVILESLVRKIPVIIFKEIKHVKLNFKGIFVCDRNIYSLEKNIKFIIKNYYKIQLEMKKNNLPTKKNFQKQLLKIINA